MNIQLKAQKKRVSSSLLQSIKAKGIQILVAVKNFITAKETDMNKRRNELDYIDYIQLKGAQDKE